VEQHQYPATAFREARKTAGRHGYVAYFPAPIPRALDLPGATVRLLAEAEGAVGRLAGVGGLLPNPDLLIRPYLLREALASTRIEGTQASLAEVLESDAVGRPANADVEEVVNYVEAMWWGLERLEQLPISTRLVCEMHRGLMAGVRGRERSPGELRKTQNWIGAPGSTIDSADFVPPPPAELPGLLADWEHFAHEEPEMPLLVQDALLHAQFETIHPFLDGNGRLGRLLLVFFLIVRGRLPAPLLYLSSYLEHNREAYYDSLQAIRETGDPLPWIELFLAAVQTQADDAVRRARRIIGLREQYRQVAARQASPANYLTLVDLLCENPVVTTALIEEVLDVSRPTALRLLKRMEEQGVLKEIATGPRGQRRYIAHELMDAVAEGTESAAG
jgi:Fic family protein